MTGKLVLEADIESRVRGRCEQLTHLANNILWAAVVITHGILDLYRQKQVLSCGPQWFGIRVPENAGLNNQNACSLPGKNTTYMDIDLLAITLRSANDGSNNDKLVLRDEVADASLVLAAAGGCDEVKFQSTSELDKCKEEAKDGPQCDW